MRKTKKTVTASPRVVISPENWPDVVKQEIQQNRDRGLVKDEDKIVVEKGAGSYFIQVSKPNGWSEWFFAYD